ncbi:hypothetical protein ONZ45_g12256 [Pleurotus djamor]|nr:hypothetical protein ONZ45_g12256 [Pleurotus djamor]
MSYPPVPPRPPYESNQPMRQNSLPPPIPPLPPDLRYSTQSPPHYDNPLAAPRPFRADPNLPANMAQSLEATSNNVNYNPGFVVPQRGPSPLPPNHHPHYPQRGPSPLPPQQPGWQPWNVNGPPPPPPQQPLPPPSAYPPQPYQQQPPLQPQPPPITHVSSIEHGMHNLSFSPQPQPQQHFRAPSLSTFGPPARAPTPPRQSTAPPSLTAPLPSIPTLLQALPTVQQPTHDPALRLSWAKDVIFLINRDQHVQSNDIPVGPVTLNDPQLNQLARAAIPVILELANIPKPPAGQTAPPYIAEAVYLRATLEASGAFPEFVKHDPRSAFRDFEAAARGGYHAAWFRLGRDYENFNDQAHAKDCFERGVKFAVESCLYRMGMAHLMGQLGLPANVQQALPLLQRAATLASLDVPQPAYVYSLLLLGEFTHPSLPPLPPNTFAPFIPPSSTPLLEARKHLERSAYLHFPPAQYKLGHFYEFATPPFPFDALLSVQYYSLASQQGEVEADMALSKWFLCGSPGGENGGEGGGGFDKDEALAWTFADKAARKGLPSAMFAMGYYAEVGVGGPKDVDVAIKWYQRAADQGNEDAKERLTALTGPSAQPLSRQEHDTITESKLVRKRTQAKQRSDAAGGGRPSVDGYLDSYYQDPGPAGGAAGYQQPPPQQQGGPQRQHSGAAVIENIRRQSLDQGGRPGPGYYGGAGGPGGGSGRMPSVAEHPHPIHASPPQIQAPLPQQTSPRPPHASPNPANTTGVGLRPQQPGRQFPNAQRYTLTDPGSGSASPPPPVGMGRPSTASPRPGTAGSGGGPSRVPSGDDFGAPGGFGGAGGGRVNKPPGPTTFAEMGFQGAKAEDKECVIM